MNKELTTDYVKDTYNTFLSSYENEYAYFRWQRTPLSRYQFEQSKRTFLKSLKDKKFNKALEVGGGDGAWTPFLLSHSQSLDFLDISSEMLKRAQERLKDHKNIIYIEGDFLENNLIENSYECLLSFRNFEYFPDKQKAASEMNRLLKKDGQLVIVTKNPLYDWDGAMRAKTLHKGQVPIKDLKALLENNGFSVDYIYPTIIGKKLKYKLIRILFDCFHKIIISLPWQIWYKSGMLYLSESVLISARKK